MSEPTVAATVAQSDPFTEFGGSATGVTPATSAIPAPSSAQSTVQPVAHSDPFAEFGGVKVPDPKTGDNSLTPAQSASIAFGGETDPLKAGTTKGAMETLHTVGAAAGKLMPNAWRDKLGLPSSFTEPGYLQATNGAETAGKVGETIAEFALGDEALKSLSIAERLGIAQKLMNMAKSSPYIARMLELGMNATRGGAVTVPQQMAHGASPTEALKTGAIAAGLGIGTGVAAEALDASGVSQKIASVARSAKKVPGQILKGENIAQDASQTALRSVAGSPETGSLREVLSKPIADAQTEKEGLYGAYDEAAGVDRKALLDRLSSTQDQMSKLTNTPADLRRLARLKDAETSAKQLIADADAKAAAKGVNIADADAANTKLRALQQVEEKIFHNQSVIQGDVASGQPETVNLDSAIRELQKLKDNEKYGGPRLEQAFGKGTVSQLMTDLRSYQQQGVHALKVQRFAKMVGATLGIGSLGGVGGRLGYKAVQHLTSSSAE